VSRILNLRRASHKSLLKYARHCHPAFDTSAFAGQEIVVVTDALIPSEPNA
jgi:hypothetical protein